MSAKSNELNDLKNIATELRCRLIEYSNKSKTPHLASCLSCVDLLTVLYFHSRNLTPQNAQRPNRDKFILSKGHAAPALFQVLAMAGYFSEERLANAQHDGSDLFGEHPPAPGYLPGIEAATGSLGHGLPIGVGFALASKKCGFSNKVDVLIGDGESNEGSNWEAALLASAQGLQNLTVFIDYNKWQATDRSNEVMGIEPMTDKWAAFGWDTHEVDGHNIKDLILLLDAANNGKPRAIVAHTIKGKGVSFMEDDNNWHYKIPSLDEVNAAKAELRAN